MYQRSNKSAIDGVKPDIASFGVTSPFKSGQVCTKGEGPLNRHDRLIVVAPSGSLHSGLCLPTSKIVVATTMLDRSQGYSGDHVDARFSLQVIVCGSSLPGFERLLESTNMSGLAVSSVRLPVIAINVLARGRGYQMQSSVPCLRQSLIKLTIICRGHIIIRGELL